LNGSEFAPVAVNGSSSPIVHEFFAMRVTIRGYMEGRVGLRSSVSVPREYGIRKPQGKQPCFGKFGPIESTVVYGAEECFQIPRRFPILAIYTPKGHDLTCVLILTT